MLKFFRKIRRGLLSEKRIGRYMLYATGEILLVVIGILIALALNNRNEQRKTEEQVEAIFSEIMEELVSDIKETRMPMAYYAQRDSTMHLVIAGEVTYEDYEKGRLPWINSLLDFYNAVNLTQHAYDNLVGNLDAVSPKFRPVIKDLNTLYHYNKDYVVEANNDLSEFIAEHRYHGMRNYPWFYGRNNEEREKIIKYKLEDFRYKNLVEEFRILGTGNQLRQSIAYRRKAIECYKQIAGLLNKPAVHESFSFDTEIAEVLLGEWYVLEDSNYKFTYFMRDERLFVKNNFNDNQSEVFYVARYNKLLDSGMNYAAIMKENDETILKFYDYSLKKVH